MLKFVLSVCLILGQLAVVAQTQDTVIADTAAVPLPATTPVRKVQPIVLQPDTVQAIEILPNNRRDTIAVAIQQYWKTDSSLFVNHPYFHFTNPARYTFSERKWVGKEAIFYGIIGLLIFFAIIRNSFNRYLQDLFKVYFRTSIRQRQIKDQLIQSPLPSLLLNLFFLFSTGMFIALLLQYFKLGTQFDFWMLYLYSIAGLLAIYGVKFLLLKFMGWALQVSEATDAYIFIVFTTNKMVSITILPFLIMLALASGTVSRVAVTFGISLVVGLFTYRYFLSYISIHKLIRISFFHFMIYLCAFEIAPLLLINKLLFRFIS